MIRGYFRQDGARHRPFLLGQVSIPSQGVSGRVSFLVDTGADATLLAPRHVLRLRVDLSPLPAGSHAAGVGGATPTVQVPAVITLDDRVFSLPLRLLAPTAPAQRRALARIPALLGRDILAHFALFMEERPGRVLLLDPDEAEALGLP